MARYVNDTRLEVVGWKEALRELNKIDKVARRQVTKDYAQIVSVIIQEAQQSTPTSPPLSGMKYQWKARGVSNIFPWNDKASDRSIKPFVSGKRPRSYGAFTSDLATFGVKWTAADALTVEMSGRGPVPTNRGRQMVAALSARYGTPGRFLWKAYENHKDTVYAGVKSLMDDVMRQIESKLK